jgi:hypothetical protein
MCDQAHETIQHLLTACIFARQFWHTILAAIGLGHLTPAADEENFADWWGKASHKVVKTRKKGLNSDHPGGLVSMASEKQSSFSWRGRVEFQQQSVISLGFIRWESCSATSPLL